MDFDQLKNTYQQYENWNPAAKVLKKYESGEDEAYIQSMTEKLIAKTKAIWTDLLVNW